MAFIDAKSHFKNIKSTQDILKFEWDNNTLEKDTSISNEDIERLRKLSQKNWKENGSFNI